MWGILVVSTNDVDGSGSPKFRSPSRTSTMIGCSGNWRIELGSIINGISIERPVLMARDPSSESTA